MMGDWGVLPEVEALFWITCAIAVGITLLAAKRGR